VLLVPGASDRPLGATHGRTAGFPFSQQEPEASAQASYGSRRTSCVPTRRKMMCGVPVVTSSP